MSYDDGIDKAQFKWLVKHLGYSFGLFGTVKWAETDAKRIIEEWSRRYDIQHLISDIYFLGNGIQINSTDVIVHELVLRTIKRPAWGDPPQIAGKPLTEEYESLIREYFR